MVLAVVLLIFLMPWLRVAGTWNCVYTYSGSTVDVTLRLGLTGTYTEAVGKNGVARPEESGKYEIVEGKVRCYSPGFTWGNGSYWEYDIVDGKYWVNGSHCYSRK